MYSLKRALLIAILPALVAVSAGAQATPSTTAQPAYSARPPAIVIGFVGGFVRRDNTVHSVVQLADSLRQQYPSGVDVEVFENRHVDEAHRRVLALLAANSHETLTTAEKNTQGVLTQEEKRGARIVLYGHSWGGAAVVELARDLQHDGIPVLLTVQVDAIPKPWGNASVIPSNVLEAANFYQTHGIFQGVKNIRAEDPSKTRIIENDRLDYSHSTLVCTNYPWWDRHLLKSHTQIECDPALWSKVASLITSAIAP